MQKHFPIIVEQDEDNMFIVSCPIFKGCHSYGDTLFTAMQNIKEVILLCCLEDKEQSLVTKLFYWYKRFGNCFNKQY